MIKITGIEIEDFGRHKHIKKSFDGNVIGLAGPNGRGKSTVLHALQLALTGTIDHTDPLQSFIRLSSEAAPPKKAKVKVDFVADGKRGSITRTITKSTNSRELVWEGLPDEVKSLTAEKRVADTLYEIMGVDKKAVNSTVFISQGEMTRMFGKDTERRDFYTRLLMLGPLDKAADVVEVYRKQIADSLQDLSAVKDAADYALDQAIEFRELCYSEFEVMKSPKDDVASALKLVGLFNQQASAEMGLASAETCMAATPDGRQILEEAGSFEDYVANLTAEIEVLQSQRDDFNMSRRRSMALTSSKHSTAYAVDTMTNSIAAFRELDDAADKLELAKLTTPHDPSERIATYESYLRNFDHLDDWNAKLPAAEAAVADAENLLIEHSTNEVDSKFDAASSDLKSTVSDLNLRKNLKRELSGTKESSCCTVCGSNSPNSGYLDASIAELDVKRDQLTTLVRQLTIERSEVHDKKKKLQSSFDFLSESLAARKVTFGRLTISMMSVGDRAAISDYLNKSIAEKNEFLMHSSNLARLSAEYEAKSAAADRHTRVTAEQYARAETEAEEAALALSLEVVDPEMDNKDKTILNRMSELRTKRESSLSAMSSLTAARTLVRVACDKLSAALIELPTTNPNLMRRLSKSGEAVTVSSMTESAEEMRLEQSAYDSQLGKLSVAEKSEREANDHVASLNRKIAEQGSRRLLSLDLARLRDTFRPSGASLDYIDYRFGQIATMASEYLAESHADFMVAASSSVPLSFEFIRLDQPGETWMPQNRMSGGQKVRLAVATLRAIHALVMPGVGLLVLDEPTTHLDDEAKSAMADMLKKIGEEGTLQMIVCDHSPVLIDAFSDIIEIDN